MVIYNNKSETQQVAPGTLAHPTKWQGVYNGLSTHLYWNLHIPHQKSVKKWHINDIIDSHTLRKIPCDSDELKVCAWWQDFFLHFFEATELDLYPKMGNFTLDYFSIWLFHFTSLTAGVGGRHIRQVGSVPEIFLTADRTVALQNHAVLSYYSMGLHWSSLQLQTYSPPVYTHLQSLHRLVPALFKPPS